MIAGAMFRVVSIICPSTMNRLVWLFRIKVIIMYDMVVVIISIIISTWSWKKSNCSKMGDVPSCSLMFNHVVIDPNESPRLYVWSLKPMNLSATLDFGLISYWLVKWLVVLSICALLVGSFEIIRLSFLFVLGIEFVDLMRFFLR
jgi:hypothetical protein